ncbi:MAG: formate dehydrogenase accessory sulfurtransferase FdhD [Actinobacteria bacterium]|nr:formate dehydrogenase accessory sulfurtransferase FdhD [Actinomycetota bacterium]
MARAVGLPASPPVPPGEPAAPAAPVRVVAVRGGRRSERADRLAVEEPMEIQAAGPGQDPAGEAVTMRTPGDDFELAAGFMFTEGLVRSRGEVRSVRYCDVPEEEQHRNVVTVRLFRPFDPGVLRRNFPATSSCGVCGKASLDQVELACEAPAPGPVLRRGVVEELPERMRSGQRIFDRTGGLHAAGLFDPEGRLLALREDVGRHNAVDKLVGRALLSGELPLSRRVLMVSGRLSFEIVQKAAMAGLPVVCAVSAPSTLAVDAARRLGMTVVGFLRGDRFNVYSGPERIDLDA